MKDIQSSYWGATRRRQQQRRKQQQRRQQQPQTGEHLNVPFEGQETADPSQQPVQTSPEQTGKQLSWIELLTTPLQGVFSSEPKRQEYLRRKYYQSMGLDPSKDKGQFGFRSWLQKLLRF